MSENDFEAEITSKDELLVYEKLLDKYDFDDLAKSIFCFNSYLGNRAHITLIYRLNYYLIHHKHTGKSEDLSTI